MRNGITRLTLIAAAIMSGFAVVRAESGTRAAVAPVSYYGDNDLKDYYQAAKVMRKLAESTAALFDEADLPRDVRTGTYLFLPNTLKKKYDLRDQEPFASQPVGSYCTGALVGEDLVLTSGHCFQPDPRGGPCEKIKFVFGYAMTGAGKVPSSFPAENVYSCKQIKVQKVQDDVSNFVCGGGGCSHSPLGEDGADYAIVQLDRKVAGRYPLAISRTPVAEGARVGIIGYPGGMPVKVQESGAIVRSVLREGYFVTNLDAFGGNSGSPVFNLDTLKIEGILVRGGEDYVYDSATGAGRAQFYPQNDGPGEEVTLVTEVQALIPGTEMERYINNRLKQGARPKRRVQPAVYPPGQASGLQIQPAVYNAPEPSGPEPVRI